MKTETKKQKLTVDDWDSVVKWSYAFARKFVEQHLLDKGINSARKFAKYKKDGGYLPKHFPKRPDDHFKNKGVWKGWPDFFCFPEHERTRNRINFFDYETSSRIAQQAGIKHSGEFKKWKDRPVRVPSRPDQYYKSMWKGWDSFLGEKYSVPHHKASSKLTANDVRIIRHQLRIGVTGAALAKFFGVSEMQISRIRHGENWKDVESTEKDDQ